ncbi:MAG: hypothetical protein KDJ88_05705 [Bauldia sp.]|nr:hypothetical protein [Bauldia sp.]
MTREQEIFYFETAKRRHVRLVTRLMNVPMVRAIAHAPMTEHSQTKVVKVKAEAPKAVDLADCDA